MKHARVDDTLTWAENTPDWAVLLAGDCEPPERPSRICLVWEGETWAEIDPATGRIVCTGTVGSACR